MEAKRDPETKFVLHFVSAETTLAEKCELLAAFLSKDLDDNGGNNPKVDKVSDGESCASVDGAAGDDNKDSLNNFTIAQWSKFVCDKELYDDGNDDAVRLSRLELHQLAQQVENKYFGFVGAEKQGEGTDLLEVHVDEKPNGNRSSKLKQVRPGPFDTISGGFCPSCPTAVVRAQTGFNTDAEMGAFGAREAGLGPRGRPPILGWALSAPSEPLRI